MTKTKYNLSVDNIVKECQYLQETQRYIEELRNNLIRKILILEQSKKKEINLTEFNPKFNVSTSNEVLVVM
jgi:hypothetical protein